MNYLILGLQQTGKAIRKHQIAFVLLLVLQLFFFVSFGYVALSYQMKIFEDVQTMTTFLQELNLDAEKVQVGVPFLNDVAPIYKSYASLIENAQRMILLLAALFLFLNGLLWVISHSLLEPAPESWKKKFRRGVSQWLKLAASSAILFVPFALGYYFSFKYLLLTQGTSEELILVVQILGYLSLIIYYFLLVAFAQINQDSWKLFAKKVYEISIKKIYLVLPVLAANTAAIGLSGYLLKISLDYENSFLFIVAATFLFLLAVVAARIYFIASLQELNHEKSNR